MDTPTFWSLDFYIKNEDIYNKVVHLATTTACLNFCKQAGKDVTQSYQHHNKHMIILEVTWLL